MEVLSVVAASANDKADEIERLFREEDYKHFTLTKAWHSVAINQDEVNISLKPG